MNIDLSMNRNISKKQGCLVLVLIFIVGPILLVALSPSEKTNLEGTKPVNTQNQNESLLREKAIKNCMQGRDDVDTAREYCTCVADYAQINFVAKGVKTITKDQELEMTKHCLGL